MMRYFYYLTAWLACWLAAPAFAQAAWAPTHSTHGQVAPMEDWQLPSFVAQDHATSGTPSQKHSSSFSTSHTRISSSTPMKAGTGAIHSAVASTSLPPQIAPLSPVATTKTSSALCLPPTPATTDSPSTPLVVSHPLPPYSFASMTRSAVSIVKKEAILAQPKLAGRLARLTAYWASEGDYYTGHLLSSTGIHLHGGLCAVDPSVIPYGSVVLIPGLGQFLAADTGSAVVSRTAARVGGRTLAEKGALVIDIFFEDAREGQAFTAENPKFVPISWWTPSSTSDAAQSARRIFAEEDWNKIYSKQL